MIYITLHNLHTWGKSHMTKAGDICVAASLAEVTDQKIVHVAATNQRHLEEVQSLYRDVKFIEFDASKISKDDAIVVPILEFSRILSETREELLQFYKDLLSTDAKLFVMNIHHNKEFYRKTIESSEDREIAELAEKILKRCIYLTHDDCMNLEKYRSKCIEQIVFYDEKDVKDVVFKDDRDLILTFYRPSSFKGFNLWLKETEIEKDSKLVAVCNTSVNRKYDALVKEYSDKNLIKVYQSIEEYLEKPCESHALISSPYSIESESFQELIKRSKYCLNTTDYEVLADLNEGIKPTYLILENAMFDAVKHGLALRWTSSSVDTMSIEAAIDCQLLSTLTEEEQSRVFNKIFNAKAYLDEIQRMCK